MESILAAEVAWYVTGRFYATERKTMFDAGYFLHLQGIADGLFTGFPGEATAHLTFLAEPFTARTVPNGSLTLGLDAVGEFGVYLNRAAGASFDHPESFAHGEEVARFRRVSVVTGATVTSGPDDTPLLGLNVFSARLVRSREFELGGRCYDFARLVPRGITQWGTAAETPVQSLPGYTGILPFVGSAIAIG